MKVSKLFSYVIFVTSCFLVLGFSTRSVYADTESVPVQVIYYNESTGLGIDDHSYTIQVSSSDTVRAVAKDIPGYIFTHSTYRIGKTSNKEPGPAEVVLAGSNFVDNGWGLIYFHYKPIPQPKTYTIVLLFDDGRSVSQKVTVNPGDRFKVPGIPPGYYAVFGGDMVEYDRAIDGHTHYIKVRDEKLRNARTKRVNTHFDDGVGFSFSDSEVVEGVPVVFPGYDPSKHEVVSGNPYLKYEEVEDGGNYKLVVRAKGTTVNIPKNKTVTTNVVLVDSGSMLSTNSVTLSPGQKIDFPGYDKSKYEAVSGNTSLSYDTVEDGGRYVLTVRPVRAEPIKQPNTNKEEVRRFYHSGLKIHLYTKNPTEIAHLRTLGAWWRDEGVAFVVNNDKSAQPVYRLYNPGLKVHFYTKNENEYRILATRGWRQEGVAYRSSGNTPVYRLYNPAIKRHLYTRNTHEYSVLKDRGWRQEGVAWYVEK